MDVLDIARRYEEVERERVNLEMYYRELQERLSKLGEDPTDDLDVLQQTVNALNIEREHSAKTFGLLADLMVGWVQERQTARKARDGQGNQDSSQGS